MTSVYLPRPYDDEPLYSVVARHVAHTGAPSPMALAMSLFGGTPVPSADLPCDLDRFATATYASLGFDGAACVRNLTLAPYYARYFDPQRRRVCLDALRGRPKSVIHNLFGIATSRVSSPASLRLCPACCEEDRRERGETHWRRIHQVAGVFVCVKHGCRLSATSVPYHTRGCRDYVDADAAEVADDAATELRECVLTSVATRCADILAAGEASADADFAAARRLGSGLGRAGAGATLSAAFVEKMGEGLLQSLGCSFDPDAPHSWLLCLLRRPEVGFHPLQHALVEAFAERFACDLRLGAVIAGAASAPRAAGPCGELAVLKARWRKVLKTVPGRSRSAASAIEPALKAALDLAAPGWALGSRRRGNPKPRNHRQVDSNARDREWSRRVQEARASVASLSPPQRITRNALERNADLPKGALSRLADLPGCWAALIVSLETTEAYHIRKIAYSAATLRRARMPVTEVSVRRHTKLTGPIGASALAAIRAQ